MNAEHDQALKDFEAILGRTSSQSEVDRTLADLQALADRTVSPQELARQWLADAHHD